jgi:enoyl-CoA hydratase / 3-hydroxyacyl-CoA dehydrogenase
MASAGSTRLAPPGPVTVLGAGTMGAGIAQACAAAGFSVRVRDVDDAALSRGRGIVERTLEGAVERKKVSPAGRDELLGRLTFTTDLATACRDAVLVVEAVFEEEKVKQALFRDAAKLLSPTAIVATNTSSLSVSGLAEPFPQPERFAGLHFFFPAPINKLVEVVGGAKTSAATRAELVRFSTRLGKLPIETADRAGFCVNRFFVPYLNEACRLADEGVAGLGTIEEVGRETFGATLGPFELMNVTGIPIAFHSQSSLHRAFGTAYAPSPLLERQFRDGKPWPWREATVEPGRKAAVRERFLGLTFGIAARLVEEQVATAEAVDRGAVVGLRRKQGPFAQLSSVGTPEGLRLVEAYARPWGEGFPVSEELRARASRGERAWPLRYVKVEREGAVAWVLLDRPEVLNALSTELLTQLESAFSALATDPALRVVVLAGSGPVFAAGADIAEMAAKTPAEGVDFGFVGQRVARAIERFPLPVIALVEGYALGGGLEVALAADLVVSASGAQLGLPEVTVGIHPGMGGATRLSRLIGPANAKLLVFTGVPVSAEEAYRLGFVAKVVPADRAREEAGALARTIASRAPLGVRWVKRVIDDGAATTLDEALRLEGESAGRTFSTADRTEGMRAFLERRKPEFRGA